jgi:hypothetical protein
MKPSCWHVWLPGLPISPLDKTAIHTTFKKVWLICSPFFTCKNSRNDTKTGVLSGKDMDKIKALQLKTDPGVNIVIPIL